MRRVAQVLAAALAGALSSLSLAGAASADPVSELRPINLRVAGGEAEWHPSNDFQINWDQPTPAAADSPIKAAHYLLRDATGAAVTPVIDLPGNVLQLEHLRVPRGPGRYTAEIWLEGSDHRLGPHVSAMLSFDDALPGKLSPWRPAAGCPATPRRW